MCGDRGIGVTPGGGGHKRKPQGISIPHTLYNTNLSEETRIFNHTCITSCMKFTVKLILPAHYLKVDTIYFVKGIFNALIRNAKLPKKANPTSRARKYIP